MNNSMTKKLKKKLLTVLLVSAMVMALTACGNTGDTPEATNAPTATSEPTATAEPTATPEPTATSTPAPTADPGYTVYGTATLTYAEFYAGDVSSTDDFDAVSSATTSKYSIMSNIYSDFVDETTNADGYHILGVKNVNVAVNSNDLEAYKALNATFVESETEPAQYKTVTLADGKAVYSATTQNVAATITDATAVLQTATNWGDYQINVTDGATTYLRNARTDEGFAINSNIQGVILETKSGLKVGLEFLQSIWVQPYEVSFNVATDNTHNTHIAAFDNLDELTKLVGETVTKVIYIMPDATYIYEFEGIYIKPAYVGDAITSTMADGKLTLSTADFSVFTNATLAVTYTVGSGRSAQKTVIYSGAAAETVDLDLTAIAELAATGTYTATLSSDNYADIAIAVPATDAQIAALNELIATAETKYAADSTNETLKAHIDEAKELIAAGSSSSAIATITSELTSLTADQSENAGGQGGNH